MIKFRKSVVAAAVAGTAVLGAGTAYAYVVATGHGSSKSTVATPVFTMTVTPGTVTALQPGAAGSAIPVTIANTSGQSIRINSVTLSIPAAESCGGSITVTQPVVAPNMILPAGTSATLSGATAAMQDSTLVDQTACMGSTFTINASVNGG